MRELKEVLEELKEYGCASFEWYDGTYNNCIEFRLTDDGKGQIIRSSQYDPPHEDTVYCWTTDSSETGDLVEILTLFLQEVLDILEKKNEGYRKVKEKVNKILATFTE